MDARSGAPNLFSGAATRTGHPPRWRLPVGGWMERVTGIEPAFSAWEADVLPLNYTREVPGQVSRSRGGLPLGSGAVILSDRTIREELAAGRIVIDPLDPSSIQPSSVDLRLDRL